MPGPAPKPARQKKLEGTHRPDREAPNALDFAPTLGLPDPPPDLAPPAARRCWEVCARELHAKGMLATVDLALLRAYCYQVHLMLKAESKLNEEGETVLMTNKGGGQYPVKSPWVGILSDATEKVNKLGQQFGFSPASRTRISAPTTEKPKADPWATL